jgi:hypothetical protein
MSQINGVAAYPIIILLCSARVGYRVVGQVARAVNVITCGRSMRDVALDQQTVRAPFGGSRAIQPASPRSPPAVGIRRIGWTGAGPLPISTRVDSDIATRDVPLWKSRAPHSTPSGLGTSETIGAGKCHRQGLPTTSSLHQVKFSKMKLRMDNKDG